MLKVTSKKYEIEEKVQFERNIDGESQVLYEFDMQITSDELQELKDIIFGFANDNFYKYQNATLKEKMEIEEKLENNLKSNEEKFIDICFKEHKKCKDIVGEYKFYEMLDVIRGYLTDFFIKKQISPYNTTITNLTKNINNLQNLR